MNSSNLQESTALCWNLTKSNRSCSYGLWSWREIQTHTFPWLKSLSPTEQMHGESSAPPAAAQIGRWREIGKKKWGKTATEEAKSNTITLFLSPSASLTSHCISTGWKSFFIGFNAVLFQWWCMRQLSLKKRENLVLTQVSWKLVWSFRWARSTYFSHAPLNCGKTTIPHEGSCGKGEDDDTADLIRVKWK